MIITNSTVENLAQIQMVHVAISDVSYDTENDVITSKCCNCGESWEHSGQQTSKISKYSVDKIDGSHITLKVGTSDFNGFYRFENVCSPCTVKRVQQKDKDVSGSENIHLEGHSYVRNNCICFDDSYREKCSCYNKDCDTIVEYDPGQMKTASCNAVTVSNVNGKVYEREHSSGIAICGGQNIVLLCGECEKDYEIEVNYCGMFNEYKLKPKKAE